MVLLLVKQNHAQHYFNNLVDYNTQNYEALSGVIQQKDSSYLAVGFSYDYNITGSNYYSVYCNKYGQKIHENFLSIPFKESQGMAIKKISDTTFIVCGLINDLAPDNSTRTNRDMFLLKVKNNGDTLWTKRYGLTIGTASSPDYEIANDVIKTSDNGFAMVGFSYPTGSYAQIYLVKTDSEGNFLWQKTYGGGIQTEPIQLQKHRIKVL